MLLVFIVNAIVISAVSYAMVSYTSHVTSSNPLHSKVQVNEQSLKRLASDINYNDSVIQTAMTTLDRKIHKSAIDVKAFVNEREAYLLKRIKDNVEKSKLEVDLEQRDKAMLDVLNNTKTTLSSQFHNLSQSMDAKSLQMDRDFDSIQLNLSGINEINAKQTENHDTLKKTVGVLRDDIKTMDNQVQRMDGDMTLLNKFRADASSSTIIMKDNIDSLMSRMTAREEDANSMRQSQDTFSSTLALTQNDVGMLQKALEKINVTDKAATDSINALSGSLDKTAQDVTYLKTQTDTMAGNVTNLEKQLASVQSTQRATNITSENNRVGINRTQPAVALHVQAPPNEVGGVLLQSGRGYTGQHGAIYTYTKSGVKKGTISVTGTESTSVDSMYQFLHGDSDIESMRILANGSVGIGMAANPVSTQFQVNPTTAVPSQTSAAMFNAKGTGADTNNWIAGSFGSSGMTDRVAVGTMNNNAAVAAYNAKMTSASTLHLNPTGGKVHVGVENAKAQMEVNGDMTAKQFCVGATCISENDFKKLKNMLTSEGMVVPRMVSGKTKTTDWQKLNELSGFVDVDLRSYGFTKDPQVFTSLAAKSGHTNVVGVTSIQALPSSKVEGHREGFRVFLNWGNTYSTFLTFVAANVTVNWIVVGE